MSDLQMNLYLGDPELKMRLSPTVTPIALRFQHLKLVPIPSIRSIIVICVFVFEVVVIEAAFLESTVSQAIPLRRRLCVKVDFVIVPDRIDQFPEIYNGLFERLPSSYSMCFHPVQGLV